MKKVPGCYEVFQRLNKCKGEHMVRASITFLMLALIAYMIGVYGLSGITPKTGEILLLVFLGISIVVFIIGLLRGRKIRFL